MSRKPFHFLLISEEENLTVRSIVDYATAEEAAEVGRGIAQSLLGRHKTRPALVRFHQAEEIEVAVIETATRVSHDNFMVRAEE